MRALRWPRQSITGHFALVLGTALAFGFALFHFINVFVEIGDGDDRPPLSAKSQADPIASIVRMIDVAPPSLRSTFAGAAGTQSFRVDWRPPGALAQDRQLAGGFDGYAERIEALLGDVRGSVLYFHGGTSSAPAATLSAARASHPEPLSIAAVLHDGSWLVFTAPNQAWYLGRWDHVAVKLGIISSAIMFVSFFSARGLARPIASFAVAARRFGTDPNAPPMAEQGPTEMRQAIAAFNTMQLQIQRFVSDQAAMFAAISHDLRTPLTRMRLRGEFIADPQQQARLFRDVDDMQSMVEASLAFLRDNAAEEKTTSLDLPELLRTIADDHADMGTEVPYMGPDHFPFLGRPIALKRAFGNLVDNAVKYGVHPAITLRKEADRVVVVLSDQGPGIPADALEDVFTPFRRVDPSRNRHTGGIGLGLTAARAGFRAHGGDVSLVNGAEGGLRATVILPLSL